MRKPFISVMLQFYISLGPIFYLDNTMLMVWLNLGTIATWVGLGKDHVVT